MKNYRQLIKELPSKKVVMAFGRFQPPTTGHELLVNAVKKIAQKQGADHIIFASRTQDKKSNPLPVDRKVYYLKRMFPNTNFVAANEEIRTFIEAAKFLSKKYKNLVMLAGSDRVPEYKRLLERYNGDVFHFDTVEVVSAGERDPDADNASGMSGTKMREAAKKGDFQMFKKGLPHTLTELDGKRLMNEIRQGLGMEAIREQVKFETNELREKYHAGEIFNVGDKVTDGESIYEVVDRGANYITVVNENGDISKKWLDSVQPTQVEEDVQPGPAPEEISFKGYETKNLHHSADATKAFESTIQRYNAGQIRDAVAILNALKATDTYMKINDYHLEQGVAPDRKDLAIWKEAHGKARESLNKIGEFMHHMDYWHNHEHEIQGMETKFTPATAGEEIADSYTPEGQLTEMKFSASDKIKVARVIATALGIEDVEKSSNPEQLVNNALRKVRSKPMRPEYIGVLHNMLQTAREADIKFDEKLVPQKANEATEYWKKPSFIKRMSDAAKRERLAREKKEAEQKKQVKEDAELEEAVKLGSKVQIHAPGKDYHGEVGHVGEIRHGAYKGAPKTYTVDYGDRKSIQLDKKNVKLHKEETELEEAAKTKPIDIKTLMKRISIRDAEGVTEPDQDDLGGPSDNDKDNESDIDAEVQPSAPTATEVGHSIAPGETAQQRRMKIKYVHEETEEPGEDAEEDKELTQELDSITDKEIDKIVDEIDDEDDIIDAYDDAELAIIDDETGEHIEDVEDKEVKEETLNEVLSRIERMKAKARFARTKSKRERKVRIALKSRSSNETINSRARRLAVALMKKRLARKPLAQLSIGEKERIERAIKKRKAIVNRLAMKLAPRVRKIEQNRLAHKSYTK